MGIRRMNRAMGPRPINSGLDLQKMDAHKRAMEAAMKTQLLEIATPIFSDFLTRAGRPGPAEIRQLASLAWKSSLYLAEAAGMLQIDDDGLWGQPQERQNQSESEPRGY